MIILMNLLGRVEGWIFLFILVALVALFAKDFDLSKGKSWAILFGMVVLGGLMFRQSQKNKRMWQDINKRKKALKNMEKGYEELQKKYGVTKEQYDEAKTRLNAVQNQTVLDIARADQKYEEELKILEADIENTPPDQLIQDVLEIIKP